MVSVNIAQIIVALGALAALLGSIPGSILGGLLGGL